MDLKNDFDFRDIAPFEDNEFKQKMAALVKEPRFEAAVRYVMPDVDFPAFVEKLLQVPGKEYFQMVVMRPFVEELEKKTTRGITCGGAENLSPDKRYTFLSNHRDIVLDAALLNLCLVRNGLRTCEIAIGDNLLIYEWITDLVKLNKSFIVKRNLRAMQALNAARELSAYIHYAVNEKGESVWIAHREGRAKDSNDITQESLVKMLALWGEGTTAKRLCDINPVPVSITYEYDPNDYLKAREFLLRRENPAYKKTPEDDLRAMEIGILGFKGHVHYQIGRCINDGLEPMMLSGDRNGVVKEACGLIDRSIHSGYKIFPVNYIAYDLLEVTDMHHDKYSTAEFLQFREYVEGQLDKVDLPGLTAEQRGYMYRMILTMYANPLRNKLASLARDDK